MESDRRRHLPAPYAVLLAAVVLAALVLVEASAAEVSAAVAGLFAFILATR